MVCDDCMMVCIDLIEINENKHVCLLCFRTRYFLCDMCHKKYNRNKMSELGFCMDCSPVHGSRYTPNDFQFYDNQEEHPIYIGVELEVENKHISNTIAFSQYKDDFFYYKKDYSLSNNGVEIVSHPATFDYHIHNHWEKLFDELNNYHFFADSACGLHFHISRYNFSLKSQRILDYLINSNKDFVEKIAGRQDNGYCHLNPYKKYYEWGFGNDHYDAVNFSNIHTV